MTVINYQPKHRGKTPARAGGLSFDLIRHEPANIVAFLTHFRVYRPESNPYICDRSHTSWLCYRGVNITPKTVNL